MRSNTLAILGLVAATQALPAREKRQFFVGPPDVEFCVNNECSGNGLILTPSPKLPPGFSIGKRTPQYDGPSKGRGGNKGGKGGNDDKWGKPDDPYNPDAPSHPDYPEDEPDYPEEEPDYPEEEPDYPEEEPDYPEHDYPEHDYPEHDYPEDDYPEHDYPEDDVSRDDIIEAEQTLVLLQQVILGVTDPEQKAAMQAAIDEAKEFLKEHAGITDISAPPGVGTIFVPEGKTRRSTKPKVDVDALYDALVKLLKTKNPTFPVYMVAEQLVQLLLEEGFEFDPKILGVWSKVTPKAKRQDGIFALPGSCKLEDVIGLETTLATILLIYGPDPPASISSLRNAVTAALLFCKYAPDLETEITVEEPVEGDITIEEPVEGDIVVEEPVEGEVVVEEPEEGSDGPERPSQVPPVDFEESEEPDEEDDEAEVEAEEDEEGDIVIEEGEEGTLIVEEPVEGSIEINEP